MALMPVEQARDQILKTGKVLAVEQIPLGDCLGRVLALDVKAKRNQPPFDASAMDGYALRNVDIKTLPETLDIVGVAAAGHAFKGQVKAGQAVRILTGAPMPKGADTIVVQENTTLNGAQIIISEATIMGKHIRPSGMDFAKGALLVPRATKLNARDIGLIAAGNIATLKVHRRPRVVLFTTGDELVLPGERPRADQITSSNNSALSAMLNAWGADVINLGIIADNLKSIKRAIAKAEGVDLLITTGGASVGDHDYVQQAFIESGVKINFWKIAMRPGKPFMFGTKKKLRVIGLPGNPVAALVCARLFVKPFVERLSGLLISNSEQTAVLGEALPQNDQRQDYLRATLQIENNGSRIATAFKIQDSSMQRHLRNSDCLIIRPPHAPALAGGELVPILMLDF